MVSYNPFKMWGSWVGAILYTVSFAFLMNSDLPNFLAYTLYLPVYLLAMAFSYFIGGASASAPSIIFTYLFLMFLIPFISGFLVGWSIHSLVRYLKNRGRK